MNVRTTWKRRRRRRFLGVPARPPAAVRRGPRSGSERRKARAPRPLLPAAWPLVVLLTAALLSHLAVRERVIRLGYRLAEARRTHDELLERRDELELAIETMTRPQRLTELARTELAMRPPRAHEVIEVPR